MSNNNTTAKRFANFTDAELIGIDNDTLNRAIRIEAIERGIKPPVTLSEALRSSEWLGFERPAEAVPVYRLSMGGYSGADYGWLDKAKAEAAMEGLVKLGTTWKNGRMVPKIEVADVRIETVFFGVSDASSKAAKFEEFTQDDTEFDKVRDECLERLGRVRQDAYNARVRSEKRAEYLRLACGNEEIARAFWAKTEGGEFPTE